MNIFFSQTNYKQENMFNTSKSLYDFMAVGKIKEIGEI